MASYARIKYLEKKLPKPEAELNEKYWDKFKKEGKFLGNGVYEWCGQYSGDTRESWLMGVLICEGINFK